MQWQTIQNVDVQAQHAQCMFLHHSFVCLLRIRRPLPRFACSQYLAEVNYPHQFSPATQLATLEWLAALAMHLDYSDDGEPLAPCMHAALRKASTFWASARCGPHACPRPQLCLSVLCHWTVHAACARSTACIDHGCDGTSAVPETLPVCTQLISTTPSRSRQSRSLQAVQANRPPVSPLTTVSGQGRAIPAVLDLGP